MTSIIMRSALVHWDQNPAPDLAYVLTDRRGRRVVTWSEVLDQRRARQRERLGWKRMVCETRAYKLWVAYFDQPLMGGWQAFLETYQAQHYYEVCIWIDRDRSFMIPNLLNVFSLVPSVGSEYEQWRLWKPEFAEQYRRRSHDNRPLGVAYCWWDGRDSLREIAAKRFSRGSLDLQESAP